MLQETTTPQQSETTTTAEPSDNVLTTAEPSDNVLTTADPSEMCLKHCQTSIFIKNSLPLQSLCGNPFYFSNHECLAIILNVYFISKLRGIIEILQSLSDKNVSQSSGQAQSSS